MQTLVRTLLNAGDRVWVEDPGYPPTREILTGMGMSVVPLPVDQEGMVTDIGIRTAPRARAVVVTPSHQSPLGVSLALPRRVALLDWAVKNSAWIIEDDYDGEYRYVGRPLPALKSLDRAGRVLYSGTFSKVLYPALRLAYLVVPATEVERFEETNQTWGPGSPQLTQRIVMAFMKEGHFSRHIQKMRKLYGERREVATAGLMNVLGGHVSIDLQPGGMHLILRLKGQQSDRLLVARMLEEGLYGEAMSDWTDRTDAAPAVLVNFTNIASQRTAEALARRILKLMA
jgi:GntR family transcriptional regulator/MocR family aminotransferase